jgi:hypothetical protein
VGFHLAAQLVKAFAPVPLEVLKPAVKLTEGLLLLAIAAKQNSTFSSIGFAASIERIP